MLLNISNDHIDWHGSIKKYIEAKFNIFALQKKNQIALINKNFKSYYKKKIIR